MPTNSSPEAKRRIFLAGSIEMGKAKRWQDDATGILLKYSGKYGVIDVYNPRREDWDATWKQEITNPHFYQQVNWELDHIEKADSILFYLQSGTFSPISLMELGHVGKFKKIAVVCEDTFWRKGNVDIYCNKYDIPQFPDLEKAVEYIIKA